MFYAKPKITNHHDARSFDDLASAVNFLNNYNELGSEYEGNNSVAKLKAEDWWLLGKLVGPEGYKFRDNKLVEVK